MSASHNFSAADIMAANIEGIERGLNISMVALQRELRITLSKKGTGVEYRGGKKGKGSYRRRSAPFNPPAVDTGTLRNSVQTATVKNVTGRNFVSVVMSGLVAGVDKDARIPRWLEYGTRYMHDRPFIAPSIKVVKPKVVGIIELQMDKAIKRMRTRAMKAAQ
jgi:HK97 gp10 family phage protein